MEENEKYIVLMSWNSVELAKKVNQKIKEGYSLVGGVSMSVYLLPNSEPSFRFVQAMFKD